MSVSSLKYMKSSQRNSYFSSPEEFEEEDEIDFHNPIDSEAVVHFFNPALKHTLSPASSPFKAVMTNAKRELLSLDKLGLRKSISTSKIRRDLQKTKLLNPLPLLFGSVNTEFYEERINDVKSPKKRNICVSGPSQPCDFVDNQRCTFCFSTNVVLIPKCKFCGKLTTLSTSKTQLKRYGISIIQQSPNIRPLELLDILMDYVAKANNVFIPKKEPVFEKSLSESMANANSSSFDDSDNLLEVDCKSLHDNSHSSEVDSKPLHDNTKIICEGEKLCKSYPTKDILEQIHLAVKKGEIPSISLRQAVISVLVNNTFIPKSHEIYCNQNSRWEKQDILFEILKDMLEADVEEVFNDYVEWLSRSKKSANFSDDNEQSAESGTIPSHYQGRHQHNKSSASNLTDDYNSGEENTSLTLDSCQDSNALNQSSKFSMFAGTSSNKIESCGAEMNHSSENIDDNDIVGNLEPDSGGKVRTSPKLRKDSHRKSSTFQNIAPDRGRKLSHSQNFEPNGRIFLPSTSRSQGLGSGRNSSTFQNFESDKGRKLSAYQDRGLNRGRGNPTSLHRSQSRSRSRSRSHSRSPTRTNSIQSSGENRNIGNHFPSPASAARRKTKGVSVDQRRSLILQKQQTSEEFESDIVKPTLIQQNSLSSKLNTSKACCAYGIEFTINEAYLLKDLHQKDRELLSKFTPRELDMFMLSDEPHRQKVLRMTQRERKWYVDEMSTILSESRNHDFLLAAIATKGILLTKDEREILLSMNEEQKKNQVRIWQMQLQQNETNKRSNLEQKNEIDDTESVDSDAEENKEKVYGIGERFLHKKAEQSSEVFYTPSSWSKLFKKKNAKNLNVPAMSVKQLHSFIFQVYKACSIEHLDGQVFIDLTGYVIKYINLKFGAKTVVRARLHALLIALKLGVQKQDSWVLNFARFCGITSPLPKECLSFLLSAMNCITLAYPTQHQMNEYQYPKDLLQPLILKNALIAINTICDDTTIPSTEYMLELVDNKRTILPKSNSLSNFDISNIEVVGIIEFINMVVRIWEADRVEKEKNLRHLFIQFDGDGSNSLDLDEFQGFILHCINSAKKQASKSRKKTYKPVEIHEDDILELYSKCLKSSDGYEVTVDSFVDGGLANPLIMSALGLETVPTSTKAASVMAISLIRRYILKYYMRKQVRAEATANEKNQGK